MQIFNHAKYPVGYGEFKPLRDIAVPQNHPGESVPEGDCVPRHHPGTARHHPGRVRRNGRRIGAKSTENGAKREENQVRHASRLSPAKSPENDQKSVRN